MEPASSSPAMPDAPASHERFTIARARAGDATALRELYDAHVDRVYRLVFRLAGDADLAQELTQDTFVRAFQRLADFRGDAAFGSWLHTIASSVALNGIRSRKRREGREAPLDDGVFALAARQAEPDLRERLRRAVAELPEGCRAVFVMHDAEGYTHEEIGSALGITAGTSKAQLSRARAKLRVALKDFEGEWLS